MYIFKYVIIIIEFNNKENYQNLIHVVEKEKKKIKQIFDKILSFRIYFPKSITKVNSF